MAGEPSRAPTTIIGAAALTATTSGGQGGAGRAMGPSMYAPFDSAAAGPTLPASHSGASRDRQSSVAEDFRPAAACSRPSVLGG
jgi:hypothetical protein